MSGHTRWSEIKRKALAQPGQWVFKQMSMCWVCGRSVHSDGLNFEGDTWFYCHNCDVGWEDA